ncbi:MAG: dihydroxyacetone kinase subunit DhaK [Betaproteobacteria bacterium]|nr:dihydroxyacetone kinase subunit DhaK [Betaproteobacteria bacterium]NBO45102.1 dihydroxyacetone kinase subunit DhaK [Betaproteobacteria bacterium]NBP11395.1 dihydroxyacetone kinase subunit DhaK [Betaproteobacteria bacterium]NBQ09948.1 dihydroxyacetone kinase subunit DhaK [Betaproteobacteria bacterium]NBQ79643.1 dihydroxyacetone kinase subunit DhaK [Betaproteobacteria bacterium]
MKNLMNQVDTALAESLDGFAAAHSDIVVLGADREYVRRRFPKPGKVALISGGGSGHEPLHAGFVGFGMLDAACPGQIFTSPTPNQMLNAAQAVDGGAGVLFIVKNYSGDMMNFQMAAETLDQPNDIVIVNDDVAVEDSTYTTGRRGVAGTLIVEKILGAAAERGDSLEQLKALGDEVKKATASMGVALTSCTVPAAGKPTFQIGMHEMEMGVGIHGEPGRRRVPLASADEIADEITHAVMRDLSLVASQEVILMVNGFGGSPLLELYLMVNAARKVLNRAGLNVVRHLTGSYVTSLEMAGCSITVCAVNQEMLELWDAPVQTAALRWGR